RQRRHPEGQWTTEGFEPAPQSLDAFSKIALIARIERIDGIEALGGKTCGQTDCPCAIIGNGRCRPSARARRLEAADGSQAGAILSAVCHRADASAPIVAIDGNIFLRQVAGPDSGLATAQPDIDPNDDLVTL